MPEKAQDDDLVMSLVDSALLRPAQERDEFLRQACAGDAELLRQARHYVELEDRLHGYLDEPLFPPATEHRFHEGDLLQDRFRIRREIAQGGMGIVYEAWDEKLDRRIAIKCAKAGFGKRLPPEVRHASEISHPHVCRIFEIHTAHTPAGAIDFVTMEFLEGETLSERLHRGPIPPGEGLEIARQICAGLAAAHSQGVIHGDLKSGNVILAQNAEGSTRAVITDFGMARAGDSMRATRQSGLRGGTPDYMAPELWNGPATFATDVYALGVLLREIATGSRQVEPAGQAVPKWLSVATRCCAKEPASRFESAVDVARALEPSQARQWALVAGATALVALLTGVVTWWRVTQPPNVVRVEVLPFQYAGEPGSVAEKIFRDTAASLDRVAGGRFTQYSVVSPAETRKARATTPEQAGARLGATHVLQGTLFRQQNHLLLDAVLTDTKSGVTIKDWKMEYEPDQVRYIPVALAGMVSGALHLQSPTPAFASSASQAAYQAGTQYLKLDSTVDAAVSAFEGAVASDPDSALTHAGLAEAEWLKYGLTRGQEWFRRATESTRQAQLRNPDLPRVLYVSGTADFVNSLYEQATAQYQRAVELQPDYGDAYRYLGRVYEQTGQNENAVAAYRRAIECDPANYRPYVFLGTFFAIKDQFSLALAPLRKAVELAPGEPGARDQLGFAYKSLGQFRAAESELLTALKFGDTALVLDQLGETLMYEGRETDAIPMFQRALAIDETDAFAGMDLSICYRHLHRDPEARRVLQKGIQTAEAAKRLNPRLGSTRIYLAYFESQLGPRGAADAESEIAQALRFSPDGIGVRWVAVLTYEALGKREEALSLLASASPELLADLNRWPYLAGLQKDPRFIRLLASNPVRQ